MQKEEIEMVSYWDRMRYAFRAFVHIAMNRPIICYFDDTTIYARTSPVYLQAAAEALCDVAELQIENELLASVNNLINIPNHRQN